MRSVKVNTLFLANANAGGGNLMMIVFIVAIFAVTYFFMIKPQKKQQQKKMEMMNQLKKGDNVVLIDGLHGKIDSVNTKDKTVVVDADGIYLTFSRMAIQQILPSSPASAEPVSATPADTKAEDQAESEPEKEPDSEQKPEAPADKPIEEKPASQSSDAADDQEK